MRYTPFSAVMSEMSTDNYVMVRFMAKQNFPEINVKAAVVTGSVLGFICWLLVIPYSYSGYGLIGYMMGGYGGYTNYSPAGYMMGNYAHYSNATFGYMMNGVFHTYDGTGYYPVMDIFHNYSPLSILLDILLGAVAGVLIAWVYNWALKLK